jgi:TatD DNase family protein
VLIDSHCHLQDPKFASDGDEVIERARTAGVSAMIVVGYDIQSSRRAVEIAEQNEDIYATVGVHPHDAKTLSGEGLDMLRAFAESPKVVAVGEIGLDFYRNLSPQDVQRNAFREQLARARDRHLPVVIHSRDADESTFEILAEHAEATKTRPLGVMHCFAGDLALAERYIHLGLLISIAGTVTYPNAETTREVARRIPLDSLLIETDAPYLTPQSQRGQRNEPAYLAETARVIADLQSQPFETIAKATAENAVRLFALDRVPQTSGERA